MQIIKVGISKIIGSIIILVAIIVGIYLIYHRQYNGIWEMKGYGFSLKINHGWVQVFETTEHYYCEEEAYKGIVFGRTLFSGMGKFQLVKEGEVLKLKDMGSQVTYELTRKSSQYYEDKHLVKTGEQVEKLGMFYEMYQENYAFQSLYHTDLRNQYEKIKQTITPESSDEMLYEAMKSLVSDLKDGHVSVEFGDQSYCPKDFVPTWYKNRDQLELFSKVITENYAKSYYKFEDCMIRYGYLSDDVGLILIRGMGVESLEKSKSTQEAMNRIIREFNKKNIGKIAIDLRFNSGGFDEASLCIAGYFTDQSYVAYQKQAFYKENFTELQSISVKPQSEYFMGDVYVLTSGFTISAAETFTRALLANPNHHVTIVGEQTAGFYSDAIPRTLPDGFSYSLSNERYIGKTAYRMTIKSTSSDSDEVFEGQGIVPDYIIPVSMESVSRGKDDAYEWILQQP